MNIYIYIYIYIYILPLLLLLPTYRQNVRLKSPLPPTDWLLTCIHKSLSADPPA